MPDSIQDTFAFWFDLPTACKRSNEVKQELIYIDTHYDECHEDDGEEVTDEITIY